MDEIDTSEPGGPMNPDSSAGWRIPIIRKASAYLAAVAGAAVILSLVLASPLLLRQLGHIRGIDWTRLSNVGQTYGAASAILSAVALIGISLSLVVQTRQAKAERIRIVRERHMELLRIMLDDPDLYTPVTGAQASPGVDIRQQLFATMWMNYSRMGFQMGVLSEKGLREETLRDVFRGEPMRTWWTNARQYWMRYPDHSRPDRQFARITDEEYRKALAGGPPLVRARQDSSPEISTSQDRKSWGGPANMALGVAIGIGIVLGSRRLYGRR
jgi:hypothetical protein